MYYSPNLKSATWITFNYNLPVAWSTHCYANVTIVLRIIILNWISIPIIKIALLVFAVSSQKTLFYFLSLWIFWVLHINIAISVPLRIVAPYYIFSIHPCYMCHNFFFFSKLTILHCMHVAHFIYSSMNGHFGVYLMLIMKNTANDTNKSKT